MIKVEWLPSMNIDMESSDFGSVRPNPFHGSIDPCK